MVVYNLVIVELTLLMQMIMWAWNRMKSSKKTAKQTNTYAYLSTQLHCSFRDFNIYRLLVPRKCNLFNRPGQIVWISIGSAMLYL